MKIYIMTDLEGACYANSFEQVVIEPLPELVLENV